MAERKGLSSPHLWRERHSLAQNDVGLDTQLREAVLRPTVFSGLRPGPYEIVAPIGAGGMGEVYRAVDTPLGRTVAIKILPSNIARSPEMRSRFER